MTYSITAINHEFNSDIIFYFDADSIEELQQQINKDDYKEEIIEDLNKFDLIIIKRSKEN